MKAKTRRALLYIFMSLFILTMFTASLTLGRYSAELESDGDYQGDYEYILTDTLVVKSVDEFFDAIENGYSNIQIGDDVDNPLIIAGDINDVRTDLTIDLNGHEIQRNNRDPLLNVDDGITLTIIDSKGGGSLYNPVGSVLRVGDEGTITVAAGIFESGPRSSNARNGENAYNEYYSSTDSATGAGASIDSNNTLSVQYYDRTVNEQDGYSYQLTDENVKATLPIIIPRVDSTQTEIEWCHTVNGNMFFSSAIGDNYNSTIMQGDTYLYFTVEGDSVQNTAIAASNNSANYYYQYYVQLKNENSSNAGYTYAGRPVYVNKQLTNRYIDVDGEEQTISDSENSNIYLATVYVYNNVKGTVAANNPYAAIEATGGNIYVRGGTYYSYFGKENTYCINANSGYMSVDSSSAISFYAYGNGVCVNCDFTGSTRTGDADLRITNGNFYSELGNTISVTNGVMEIGTATFTKDASATGNNVSQGANKSVIDISSGTLTISNSAELNIFGSGVTGISARSGAKVETNNTTIEFNNNQQNGYTYNFGISSEGGDISCSGTTKLYITGSNSTGILSSRGTITGGEITGGTINIEGEFNCNVKMLSDSGEGSSELSSTVIYTNGGTVNLNTTTVNGENTDGSVDYGTEIESDGFGFVVYSGDLNIGGTGTTHIETTRGTAVYLNGGTLKVDSNSTLDVVSEIDGACTWALGSTDGTQKLNRYNGVYIRGGSLDSQGTLNVTHTGVQNDDLGEGDNSGLDCSIIDGNKVVAGNITGGISSSDSISEAFKNAYSSFKIKSYAVRIEGEDQISVNIRAGEIKNSVGGGVYVSSDNLQSEINLGDKNNQSEEDILTVTTIGSETYSYWNRSLNWWQYEASYSTVDYISVNGGGSNWYFYVPRTGGHAVQIVGGTVNIYNGTYSAAQGNGILVEGGDVTIEDGTFLGNDAEVTADNPLPGAGASYGFKMYGGNLTILDGNFGFIDSNNNGTIEDDEQSTGGGAFVMGVTSTNDQNQVVNTTATVTMTGGKINVRGSTGFAVWYNANVTFGDRNDSTKNPTITAADTGMTLETNIPQGANGSIVNIYNGEFSSTKTGGNKNGIWYGEPDSKLNIYGGIFTGSDGSALSIGATPGRYTDAVQGHHNVNDYYIIVWGGTFNGGISGNYTNKR
ncbi:MAG TPA: hypothetical protein IAC67_02890 [Candidatus Coproplasma excrementipullorum]|nr:hypothetical protein [Candidatus Coproplasma excrementipullorum]